MAIAVTQGHVQRAIDFYNKSGKYFIIGGTNPWEDDSDPPNPSIDDYKLLDVIGLKKVDETFLVIKTNESATGNSNIIAYRNQNWKKISPPFTTKTTSTVSAGGTSLSVDSLVGMVVGAKIRINSLYEGVITSVTPTGNVITLDTGAPVLIPSGSIVEGGALVEGAKYVYVKCSLNFDEFPTDVSYRQIGLCSEVPHNEDILRESRYSGSGVNEYTSLGVLEVIDNRSSSTRQAAQSESISLVLEF